MQRLARTLLVFLFAFAAAACAQTPLKPKVTAPPVKDPTSVLWIGSSFFYFNNSLHDHLRFLAASVMPGFQQRATSVTISGSGLDWHDVESYFRPNALASYSFNAQNQVVFNKLERLYDVAIMMDCSQCPVHPQLAPVFKEYVHRHAETIRKHGAQPVLFMTWAYQDAPAMTQALAEAYTREGNANDAMVLPVGLAFARSIAQKPDLNLYFTDKRHPSLAGSYLATCVTFAALFQRSPVGARYTAGLDEATARHLQQVAWETVQDFYGR